MTSPQPLDIPVAGGTLRALRFGAGPHVAVAAHGITASAMSFTTVARHLPADWQLVALDLRGRGHSRDLGGPYGMDRHAADLHAAAEHVAGDAPVALVGQSMGAYVALRAAAAQPDRFSRLVLVDGGLPLPVPDGADPDQVLAATLGPAIDRLSLTFPTAEAYLDLFRAHPALGPHWSPDVEAYVRYDLTGEPGALRSRAEPDAVRADGRDLIVNATTFGTDLERLALPALLLYAPLGMFGQAPGMLPEPLVAAWRAKAPRLTTELVPDVNHYTILLADHAAVRLAARITNPRTWPAAIRAA
ncbi:MAG TPA: alpha/beta hydrolase [Pilimelia sp.]|nr:alpha/beta hydrolase [Pilimelia sp.]